MTRRVVLIVALIWLFGFVYYNLNMPKAAGNVTTDGVVVLTGGQDRVERGVDILNHHLAKRLLISGVDKSVSLKNIATTYKIPDRLMGCCVDLGRQAIDTQSNAIETATWIRQRGFRSVRVITNNWHMARAHFELARSIPRDVVMIDDAVEVQPSIGIMFAEYNKYLFRRALMLTEGHF